MMKSLVANAQSVLDALFKDVRLAYPNMDSLDRDKLRLFSLIENRGLESLMLDLPNLDSLLLKGLETGRLEPSGPLSTVVSKVTRVPRLFSGLWLRIFDKQGQLRFEPDVNSIFFIRQLCVLFKNLELQCSENRRASAVKEYYDVEASLRDPDLLWSDLEYDAFGISHSLHFCDGLDDPNDAFRNRKEYEQQNRVRLLANRLQRICDSIAGELGFYDPYEFTNSCGLAGTTGRTLSHGTGSVSDLSRHADKYVLPNWSERLQRVFPHDAFGCYRFDNTLEYDKWKEHQTSKLIAVPKTLKAPRLIASEPTSHQWCQQITNRWLCQRMRETKLGWFLDLSNQKLSQSMVLQSSRKKGRVGYDLSTVDLKSASDRLTCWAVERFLRRNPTLLSALQSSRTPFLRDGVTGREELSLRKFASQGTAVTFPIQSLFFLACVLASLGCTSLKDARRWVGSVRVYGDDIIIPTHGYDDLRLLLTYLELKVNEDKSFSTGLFRESCGMDAYDGYDITPIKPKTLVNRGPKSERAMLDNSNNFFKRGLWNVSAWFDSTYRSHKLPVVGIGLGAVGRSSFVGSEVRHLKRRFNSNLQRDEVLSLSFVDRAEVIPHDSTSGIFQFFAENPSPDTKWQSGRSQEARLVTKSQWVDVSSILVG